jgi:predicted glycogen debranching enzyme
MIEFGKNICNDLNAAAGREWLETNGIGGFAMGTVAGCNTRRYHGVLTSAANAPLGRFTMVSKVEETVVIGEKRFELSTNRFPEKVHPQGFLFIESFRLDPFPVWRYVVDGIVIEKKIFMAYGENTSVCRWAVVSGDVKEIDSKVSLPRDLIKLEVRPLVSGVDYHHIQHQDKYLNGRVEISDYSAVMHPYLETPRLLFAHNAERTEVTGYWYRDFEYAIEKERGFDYREDLFQPMAFEFDLSAPAELRITTEDKTPAPAHVIETGELERREALIMQNASADETIQYLTLAADQFIVKRGEGFTVIAGYPWFSDWGRDTMIALPGLTLATKRPEIAKNIILEYAKHISEGMLPNRFPDAGEQPEYNTVDATLWYFEAIRAYIAATGDHELLRGGLYEKLAGIMAWHLRGTRYGIRVDTDGLLFAGTRGTQLTWMDAKIGDLVITPRIGKAVEIQALWYNALRIMSELAEFFGDDEDKARYDAMSVLCKQSFNAVFWNERDECLFDVVINGSRDASVRPNQMIAVSLPHSMLDDERAAKVVKKVEEKLLTPMGLRSLSPEDPSYSPIYEGTPFERDSAYHQGTVWAWLIGPFITAYRRVNKDDKDTEKRVAEMLAGLIGHLKEACVGQVSEIFDADAPHEPRGCPAQAWSVGELLRVISETPDKN